MNRPERLVVIGLCFMLALVVLCIMLSNITEDINRIEVARNLPSEPEWSKIEQAKMRIHKMERLIDHQKGQILYDEIQELKRAVQALRKERCR